MVIKLKGSTNDYSTLFIHDDRGLAGVTGSKINLSGEVHDVVVPPETAGRTSEHHPANIYRGPDYQEQGSTK